MFLGPLNHDTLALDCGSFFVELKLFTDVGAHLVFAEFPARTVCVLCIVRWLRANMVLLSGTVRGVGLSRAFSSSLH